MNSTANTQVLTIPKEVVTDKAYTYKPRDRVHIKIERDGSLRVTKANHRKSNFAFFLGILMLLLGILTIKSNYSLAFILVVLAFVLVGFATLIFASTELSQGELSTANFTLPCGAVASFEKRECVSLDYK